MGTSHGVPHAIGVSALCSRFSPEALFGSTLLTNMASILPLVNLTRQHAELREVLTAAMNAVFAENAFIGGSFVRKFEEEFASVHCHEFEGEIFCVGVSNGTAALSLLLEAFGIRSGDEIILPAHTFAATAESVRHVGATPVFADIDRDTYNIAPSSVARLLSANTRAVLPVHLYGAPADMDGLADVLQDRQDVVLIEDNAQGHLSKLGGRTTGLIGHAASFSFYPSKNLGACGDAGAILTTNPKIAKRVEKLRDHGRLSKYEHDIVGYNHRMDGLQAAILSAKLPFMSRWTARRQEIARIYDQRFKSSGFKTITVLPSAEAVYHLYVVEVSNRDETMKHLADKGIASGVSYPVPLHRQPAFAKWAKGPLPVTEELSGRVMSLPICPYLTDGEQALVIDTFLEIGKP